MKTSRRVFGHSLIGAAALVAAVGLAQAQETLKVGLLA